MQLKKIKKNQEKEGFRKIDQGLKEAIDIHIPSTLPRENGKIHRKSKGSKQKSSLEIPKVNDGNFPRTKFQTLWLLVTPFLK